MDDNEEPEQITLGHDFPKDLTRNIRGSRVNQTETSFDIPYGDPVKGRNYFMAFCSGNLWLRQVAIGSEPTALLGQTSRRSTCQRTLLREAIGCIRES